MEEQKKKSSVWGKLEKNEKQLQIIIGVFLLFATIFIAYFQISINNKLVNMENYVELFVYPGSISQWVIQNAGSRPVYINEIKLNGETIEIENDYFVLPNLESQYYYFSINLSSDKNIVTIFYKNWEGKKFSTTAKGVFNPKSPMQWEVITYPAKETF